MDDNVKEVLDERGKTYGSFSALSVVAQTIKSSLRTGAALSPNPPSAAQMEALDLIASKMARAVCGDPNHADNWIDIAGYAELGRKECL